MTPLTLFYLRAAAALGVGGVAAWAGIRSRRWWLKLLGGVIYFSAMGLGIYFLWYVNRRPDRAPILAKKNLEYVREQRAGALWHTLRIQAPWPEFWVTAPAAAQGPRLRGQTTSEFLSANNLEWAVNGGFFFPFHSNGPWDYYPHPGDPVDVLGPNLYAGQNYGVDSPGYESFWVSTATLGIGRPPADATTAVAGFPLLHRGRPVPWAPQLLPAQKEPRVAVGINATTVYIVVIDGRQPGYSEGCTVPELMAYLQTLAVVDALHLDGGGSATMVLRTHRGAEVVNSPIHGRHPPGRERPVANHLGGKSQ